MGQIYTLAKTFDMKSIVEELPLIDETLKELRRLAQGLKLKPVKWMIQESLFPEELRTRLIFLTKSRLEDDKLSAARQHFHVSFPFFDEPSEDDAATPEGGVRYLI